MPHMKKLTGFLRP